jgi:peptidoglycan/xylan/chitin deacetylase (PgdA/CDA1 family)
VKFLFERGAVLSGLPRLSRFRVRRDVLILAYHNIVPSDATPVGDRSLHLAQDGFGAQLDLLLETHDVVPLAEVLDGTDLGRSRPRAVLTFDDAYRGAVTAGVREVVARSLAATIFVAPAFVGGQSFWWDALSNPTDDGPGDDLRSRALTELRGEDARVRQWAAGAGRTTQAIPDHALCGTMEELTQAARTPGITFGSHSWGHPNLAALTDAELARELGSSLQWLRDRFTNVIPYISYPYGLSSPAVERAARDAGYLAGLRIEGGWVHQPLANRFAVPRLNIPAGLSRDGFAMRAAGLLH